MIPNFCFLSFFSIFSASKRKVRNLFALSFHFLAVATFGGFCSSVLRVVWLRFGNASKVETTNYEKDTISFLVVATFGGFCQGVLRVVWFSGLEMQVSSKQLMKKRLLTEVVA
jgi:ATP-dependent exoDNAse (exonuclease V) beta subunit